MQYCLYFPCGSPTYSLGNCKKHYEARLAPLEVRDDAGTLLGFRPSKEDRAKLFRFSCDVRENHVRLGTRGRQYKKPKSEKEEIEIHRIGFTGEWFAAAIFGVPQDFTIAPRSVAQKTNRPDLVAQELWKVEVKTRKPNPKYAASCDLLVPLSAGDEPVDVFASLLLIGDGADEYVAINGFASGASFRANRKRHAPTNAWLLEKRLLKPIEEVAAELRKEQATTHEALVARYLATFGPLIGEQPRLRIVR